MLIAEGKNLKFFAHTDRDKVLFVASGHDGSLAMACFADETDVLGTLQTGQPLDIRTNAEINRLDGEWELVVGGTFSGKVRTRFSDETAKKLVAYLSPKRGAD